MPSTSFFKNSQIANTSNKEDTRNQIQIFSTNGKRIEPVILSKTENIFEDGYYPQMITPKTTNKINLQRRKKEGKKNQNKPHSHNLNGKVSPRQILINT